MSASNGVLPPAVGTITFSGSQPLWASVNPASGTTEFKGNVLVDGTLTAKQNISASTTTGSAIALTVENSQNSYNIQCDGNGNLFVGVQEPASKAVMFYDATADSLTFNEPISSATPAVAATATQSSGVALGVALQLDMTGLPPGQYMCYGGTLENGVYNVSCPIAWDGTSVVGGANGIYNPSPLIQAAISTRTAGDTKIQYSAIGTGDVGTYNFFVSVIPLTVGNPF